jgi:hypothetical protein
MVFVCLQGALGVLLVCEMGEAEDGWAAGGVCWRDFVERAWYDGDDPCYWLMELERRKCILFILSMLMCLMLRRMIGNLMMMIFRSQS